MADKQKTAQLLNPLLQPLPRLRSLVVTELRGFAEKNPVDFNVFGRVFALTAGILLAIYSVTTFFEIQRAKVIAIREARSPAKMKLIEKPANVFAQQPAGAAQAVTNNPLEFNERQKAAITNNDRMAKDALAAPIEALEEPMANGVAPRISEDGRKPWFLYSRPYDRGDPRPRIAVIVGELGLARIISEAAISDLPSGVTLAFSSQAEAADAWMLRARNLGHETLLSIPMEPLDYPLSDPGAGALLSKNSNKQNVRLLLAHLQSGRGYIGVSSFSGSRMSASPEKLRPVLEEVASRGLMWLDTKLTPLSSAYAVANEIGLPAARSDFHLHEDMGRTTITALLNDVESTARQNGKSIMIVGASPMNLQILKDWLATLPQKNLSLAPLTAVTE